MCSTKTGKSSQQRATQQQRDGRKVERAVSNGTETGQTTSPRNAQGNGNKAIGKKRAANKREVREELFYQTSAANWTKETSRYS